MVTIGQLKEFAPDNGKATEYLERVELYFIANGIADDKKVAVLLTAIGRKTYALLSRLLSCTKPQENFCRIIQDHYQPKPLVIVEQNRFYSWKQNLGEMITEYIAELHRLATYCKFKTFCIG